MTIHEFYSALFAKFPPTETPSFESSEPFFNSEERERLLELEKLARRRSLN